MRRVSAAFACLLGHAEAAPTAVSINQCTDSLLVRLADPEQVIGLSRYARNPVRSWSADEASRFPTVSGTAEEILVLRPDIVLAGRFTKRATREIVREHGINLVELDAIRSLDDARAQIRLVGGMLGHPDRAEAAIGRIDAAIARARRAAEVRPVRVLPLQRRGWVSGRDTLLTSLLAVLGLDNAGSELSRSIGRQVTIETIVALKPDLLLVSEGGSKAEDQGSALLQHPALARLYPPDRRIVVPDNLNLLCGGPTLDEVIHRLAVELERPR